MTNALTVRGSLARKVGAPAVALVAATAGAVISAGPASAAVPGACPSGDTCLWTAPGYVADGTGDPYNRLWFAHCIDNLSDHGYGGNVSSAYNNGMYDDSYLYKGAYKSGTNIKITQGTGYSRLATYGFNDNTYSAYFEGSLGSGGTSTCS